MTAVLLVVRARLRARWQSWLVLAVLVGVAGGLVIAVAAGARRTSAAYPALLAWSRPPDVLVPTGGGSAGALGSVAAADAARLPQVTAAGEFTSYRVLSPASLTVWAPADSRIPGDFWHRKLLAGRLPDVTRPDEADVSFTAAQSQHLAVGDRLCMSLLGPAGSPQPTCLIVVGIEAAPGEFPPQYGYATEPVWTTPAFARQRGALATKGIALLLRRGAADVPAVNNEVSKLAGGRLVSDYPLGPQAANTEHSIRLQAISLWLLAGMLTLVGALIVGQLLSRLSAVESADAGALRALGLRPAQIAGAGLVRSALIGAAGAVLAAGLAVGCSPLFPVGLAAVAEPHPGVAADWPALGLGMAAVLAGTVACGAWPAWRAARSPQRPGPVPGRLPGRPAASSLPLPLPAVTGLLLVLRPGTSRGRVPVASAVTATAVGVFGLCGALLFSASLGNLIGTPGLYGVRWDALVADLRFGGSIQPAAAILARSGNLVARWSATYEAVPISVAGVAVDAITSGAGTGTSGDLAAVPVQGGPPGGDGDIVLGERTLRATGSRIGGTVAVSLIGQARLARFRVTGTAVFPALDDTIELGTGAELTADGLRRLVAGEAQLPSYTALLVAFRPGVNTQRGVAALTARLDQVGPFVITPPTTPADLVNFGQLQDLPLLLGLSLATLALLTTAHLLLTTVHRRRRDLAVLRALGFTRRQVGVTVASMALTLAVAALAIGIPAGLLFGRQAWNLFASQLGIQPVVIIPAAACGMIIAAGLALAVAIAAVPGALACRARPAIVLRTE